MIKEIIEEVKISGLVKYVSYKRGLTQHWSDKVGSFFDGNKRPGKYKIYLQIDNVKARKCFYCSN